MKKIVVSVLLSLLLLSVIRTPSFAASKRYITCDACGLCPKIVNGTTSSCTVDFVPGDWKRCVKCLYPTLFPPASNPNAAACNSLLINENTGTVKFPVTSGRQFTMLGCITSGSSIAGFADKSGAPSFVQALLNVLFTFAGGLAFIYLMYGGFIIMTSQADPERLNYGRRLIYGSIIGLIFTFGSVFIVNLVGSGILRIPGFNGATVPTP
jgi:hypothetical protein